MKNALTKLFIFATGAVIGSLATMKYAEKKYSAIAEEEIASVREVYRKKGKAENGRKNDREQMEKIINNQKYADHSEKERESESVKKPYVITPEEFGEDYEAESLVYYADGVLADYYDEPIDDIDEYVGKDSLNHFGEYEDDSVYVRNDEKKIDYEILRDDRKFSDVYSREVK